jgi:hypothetical protein
MDFKYKKDGCTEQVKSTLNTEVTNVTRFGNCTTQASTGNSKYIPVHETGTCPILNIVEVSGFPSLIK